MPTKINKASANFSRLRDELLKKGQKVATDDVAPLIVKYERQLFELTVRGWYGKPDAISRGKQTPKPIFKVFVRSRRSKTEGVTLTIRAYMAQPNGGVSPVWEMLSFGRGPFVQRKTSPPLRKRVRMVTSPNRLRLDAFPGYTGEVYVIRAGTTVRGIPGRNWYEIIQGLLRTRVKFLFSDFEVVETFVKRAF